MPATPCKIEQILLTCLPGRDPNKYMNGSWVPTLGGAYWPIHSYANREYLEVGTTRHNNKSGFKTTECEFWKTFLPTLLKSGEKECCDAGFVTYPIHKM